MRNLILAITLLTTGCACAPKAPEPLMVEASTQAFDPAYFTAILDELVMQCPLNAGVGVVLKPLDEDLWGLTSFDWDTGLYLIEIEARQSPSGVFDTLVHEWAHAMVWDAYQADDHGELWGVAVSRAYRASLVAGQAYQATLLLDMSQESLLGDM